MRRHNVFTAILLSPFSRGLYRDVAGNWRGIGLLYLIFVLMLSWGIVMIQGYRVASRFARDEFPKVSKDFPPINLQNGKVSSPVAQPYTIRNPDTNKAVFVLDTTGRIKSLDQTSADVLVTETHVFVRDHSKVKPYDLSQFPDFSIDRQKLQAMLVNGLPWVMGGGFLFFWIFSVIKDLLLILLYGAIGLAFSSGFNANLKYSDAVRLSAIAMTPMIIADTVLWLLNVSIPFFYPLSFIITLAYVGFAVWSSVGVKPAFPMGGMPQPGFSPVPYPAPQYAPTPGYTPPQQGYYPGQGQGYPAPPPPPPPPPPGNPHR